MENYLHTLKEKGYSSSSIQSKCKTIQHFVTWLHSNSSSVQSLTYNQLLHYIKAMQTRGAKQITINNYITSIKQYLNYLVNTQQIQYNPILAINIQGVKRNMLHNILSPEELEIIYNNYNTDNNPNIKQRNKIIIGLLIYQGITVRDLSHLQPQHINVRQGLITIPSTRRSNERTLKLQAHQIFDMHQYITETRPQLLLHKLKHTPNGSAPPPLEGAGGRSLFISIGSSNKLNNVIQKLIAELKRTNSNLHSFDQIRASVISHWIKQYNLRQAQYMAGHRYVSSTERYQSHNIEHLQHIINKHILDVRQE